MRKMRALLRKILTHEEDQRHDKRNLEHRKCKLKLSINPHKEKIGENEEKSKDSNPNSGGHCGRPKL
jgi:hypothetical protein